MASKRMKNRIYWAHVKAQTYRPDSWQADVLRSAYVTTFIYQAPRTDRELLAHRTSNNHGWTVEKAIEMIEEKYGPAGLRNVHNRDLWIVRERLATSTY